MSSTCNHVAAALFRVEETMRLALTNPACIAKACEWLPNRKNLQPVKIKDSNLKRDDLAKKTKLQSTHQSTTIRKHERF